MATTRINDARSFVPCNIHARRSINYSITLIINTYLVKNNSVPVCTHHSVNLLPKIAMLNLVIRRLNALYVINIILRRKIQDSSRARAVLQELFTFDPTCQKCAECEMSNEYVYRQVKKCEMDSVDGIYVSTDGGEKFVKDSFVMYRNNQGAWILCEVLNGTSTKLFYAARSGKDVTLVNWLFHDNRKVEQCSAMRVSPCAKNTMQARSSSSASLPVESNRMTAYESSSVYSSTSLQNENHTLRGRIAELERLLAAQQDRANALQDEVRQREDQVSHIKAELKSLTHQHHDVLRALKNDTEPTLQQVTAQKSHIAELEKELAAEKTLTASLKATATCAFQKQNSLIDQLTNSDACIAQLQGRIAALECARDDPANDPEMCKGAGSVLLSSTSLPTPEWVNDPVYCGPPPVPVSASQNYADANTDTVAADERTMNLERTVAALVAQVNALMANANITK